MKHNIKRYFGLFLAVCMLLTAVPLLAADAAQQADEPQEELSQIAVFMQQLGLIGQDAQAGTKVTRADLAGAVYALSGSPTFTEAKKPQGVPETDAAYKAISYCFNMGILNYRPFMPTQTITLDDAVKALLRVLDYDSAIQTYYNQARTKILKGAGASGKDVTVNSFATMLYNALLMRPFEIVGVNGDILNKEKSEDTLFYQAFHVVIVEDAVVNSISKDVNATTITLNNTTVIVPQTIDNGFLGRKSDFFVQYDEFYGTNTLIYVAYDDVKSYRANLDDIIDVAQNLSRVTVLNDEDEDVKIKITPDIKLILNGQVVYPVTTDSFQPTYQYAGAARLTMSGSITFFDNDQNGTYDTAVMDAWREYYVGRVIGAKKVLMEKYPSDFGKINTMDIFDEDHYQDVTVIRNNKEVEFTSIKPQDVLMIKETMGSAKPSVVIEAVNNRMSGTVEGIRNGALIIKGQEYPYSQYLKKTMEIYSGAPAAQAMQAKIGDTVNCKMNQNNEIVSITVVPASNYTYAYLVGAKKGGFSAGNQIYVFEKTGFKTLEISASAKLNGSSSYSGDVVSHLDINTPIKYRANKDGVITSIYNDMPVRKLAAAEFDGGAFYEGGSVYNLNSRTTILGVGIQNDGVVNKYYCVPMSAGLIENGRRFKPLFHQLSGYDYRGGLRRHGRNAPGYFRHLSRPAV